MRKAKIIATIGPGSQDISKIQLMMKNKVDFFRLNLKHNTPIWHQKIIDLVKRTSGKTMVDFPTIDSQISVSGFDISALSHVKKAKDITDFRERLRRKKESTLMVAKVEEEKALQNIDEIINEADAIMIARGDLGKNIPIEKLAIYQKQIIDKCRYANKPVIVATEMLLSMINSPNPTRAEACDVANAVFDGTDALMLSEETAIGKYPVESVEMMNRIILNSEKDGEIRNLLIEPKDVTQNVIMTAVGLCQNQKLAINKIIVFTKSGKSAIFLSSFRLKQEILAICDAENVRINLSLGFGVIPIKNQFGTDIFDKNNQIFDKIKNDGLITTKDRVVIIHGNNWLQSGAINTLSIRDFSDKEL